MNKMCRYPSLRLLPNGTLVAPHRGEPPPCPDGYYKDKRDKYVYHPILFKCEHLELRKVKPGCPRKIIFCLYNKCKVEKATCHYCQRKSGWWQKAHPQIDMTTTDAQDQLLP